MTSLTVRHLFLIDLSYLNPGWVYGSSIPPPMWAAAWQDDGFMSSTMAVHRQIRSMCEPQ